MIISIFALILAAHADNPSELAFDAKVVSKAPYQLKFTPPSGHHFNLGAPTKVELSDGQLATLEKDPQKITAKFAAQAGECQVKAALYVCNDANTYCRPVRQNYDCQTLTRKN